MNIRFENLVQSFGTPPTTILHGLNAEIRSGEFVALTGRSGSGKSTLLYLLGTLDQPASGKIYFDGEDSSQWDEKRVHQFRNEKLGFVFQFHYLIPELTAIENVLLPARKLGRESEFRGRAIELLAEFGLRGKENRRATQLSGGEQQRVAVARALILRPALLLADEPTGNLDSENGETVLRLFETLNREHSMTVLMVTHDPDYAARATRQIHLVDGRIASE
jgi:ABC-type lipoprotein export system ATPase subunit